jgi:hypothetical protein
LETLAGWVAAWSAYSGGLNIPAVAANSENAINERFMIELLTIAPIFPSSYEPNHSARAAVAASHDQGHSVRVNP